MTTLHFSDSVLIALRPDAVYDLVSDVTRTGEWSPICTGCWWDEGDVPGTVGAWFTGRNEVAEGRSESTGMVTRARTWETRSQVVAADRGREFSWEVNDGWVRWGFALAPEGDGTRLTEEWTFLSKGIAGFREKFGDDADDQIALRSEQALRGIPVTLAAIKGIAEGS